MPSKAHRKGDAEAPHQPRFIPPSAEPLLLDTVPIRPSSRSSQCRENRANAETEAKMMKPEKGLIASLKSYPPGVFFMLGNEFCERFSFYGMRAILVLYLINEHHFQESTASLFYHAFTCLAYISPLLGSIAADNYFGRFRVILWVSLIYVLGHALLSIGAVPYLGETFRYIMDFGGLAVIALATGGIKPCVSAFAADQFDEDKHEQRTQFFSFFYFAINAGSLVAIMVTPILRGRVKCFNSEYCFPLAFGVPGVLMLFAFIIFVSGWRYYKIAPAGKGNVIWKVFKCIAFAIRGKFNAKLKGQDKAVHWLDYASPKYSEALIAGVKSLVSVSILFIPIVFFWALFDQQGSTWVLQARRMDGRVGPLTILPDQMNTFNPLIILISVPIFEAFIYPALRRVCNVTPLRKMAAGGVLAALAFIMAGLLQLKVNDTMEPRPAPGNVFVQRIGNSSSDLKTTLGYDLLAGKNEWPAGNYTLLDEQLELKAKPGAYVVGVFEKPDGGHSVTVFPYACEKSENGKTRLYLLVDKESKLVGGNLFVVDNHGDVHTQTLIRPGAFVDIQPKFISSPDYVVVYGGNCSGPGSCEYSRPLFAQMGAAHVVSLVESHEQPELHTVVRSNSVNMLWQLPQFLVITLGEVLFSVTGLEFSYSQAAPSMKSVLQALWLMTTFFGNLIDMGISGTHVIHEPATEFFVYAVLMLVVMGIFTIMALRYKYVDERDMESISEESDDGGTCVPVKEVPPPALGAPTEKSTSGV